MKVTQYNNYSPKMVKKLKPNERATYRVLNIRPDPDNYGRDIIPAAVMI